MTDPWLTEPPHAITAGMRVRRSVPGFMLPAVLAVRASMKRHDRAAVAKAREEMRHLIGAVAPQDVERAADAYLERFVRRSELRYHPTRLDQQDIEGLDRLTSARRRGGVVLNFLHHGHYEGAMASLGRAGEPVVVMVHPVMLAPDAPSWLRQHVGVVLRHGNRVISAAAGSSVAREVLESGGVLAVATDVPSTTRTHFLGADRIASAGAARLAMATSSRIVVLSAHRSVRGVAALRLHDAVDAGDFSDPDRLLLHLLRLHEEAVLGWPEAYDQPLMRWGVPARADVDRRG